MEALLLLLLVALYFLPVIVASSREHHHVAPIFVLNLLLGWTLVGWVVSLVWAVMPVPVREGKPGQEVRVEPTPDATPTTDQVDRVIQRWGAHYR